MKAYRPVINGARVNITSCAHNAGERSLALRVVVLVPGNCCLGLVVDKYS